MKRYGRCSKILEDTRVPRIYAGTDVSWVLGCMKRFLSGAVYSESAKGGVCLAGDFFKKMPKKFKISSLLSVNCSNSSR